MNFVSCILCLVFCTLYCPPLLTAEFLIEMLMLLTLLLLLLSHMTAFHRGCLLMLWRDVDAIDAIVIVIVSHDSFSSRLPLDVMERARMNSSNSIEPSWKLS